MQARPTPSKKAEIQTISDTEARIVRTFDAPRELVWRAHTDARLVEKWLGPRRLKMRVETMDVRKGGRYRYVNIDTDGTEYAFSGEFLDVVPHERITQTWTFEGMPDASFVETMTFIEKNGVTTLTVLAKYKSREHIEAHMANGMEDGMNEGYERLDELLQELRA